MRPDIPFWTWVLARRIPIFALITTLIISLGATLVSQHTPSYFSKAEIVIDPELAQSRSIDSQTHFEFLKFRALTSSEIETAIAALSLTGDPIGRIQVRHDLASGTITLGFHDHDPETALLMTRAITQVFLETGKELEKSDAERRIEFYTLETQTLLDDITQTPADTPAAEKQITKELFEAAMANLSKAKADLQMPTSEVLSVLRPPTLASSPTGPEKTSMYLALISFAIFCGVVAILILEWLDTIIRRPHDIEATLGFATFGVIPDLKMQPILNTANSKRGI